VKTTKQGGKKKGNTKKYAFKELINNKENIKETKWV
jgi:hypothetical protein